ncbi:MAG: biotin--[acetyl-CoA-carboxylase] ligase [Sphaerochaetaceae bacterium]|nr:biotin--[acetyl-CoA-carboxylase] ligase [Sphaerochaetaceae bacterium]
MTTKDMVLKILEQNKDLFVSGEELAKKAYVSRAAVWKAVSSLQKDGYQIEGVSRKGYRLLSSDLFSKDEVAKYLKDIPFFFYEDVDSTNTEAKRLLNNGTKAPFVCIAKKQSGGRGRRGRSFLSQEGGIYFSIALPANGSFDAELVTTAAATGIAEAIESLGLEVGIKWVNDLFVRGKKAVGILTEGVVNLEEGCISEVIIGIGTNYTTGSFPPELKEICTSLFPDGKAPLTRSEFAAKEIEETIKAIYNPDYLTEYRKRCFVLGKEITVLKMNASMPAKAIDLDDRAHLVVQYPDGTIEHLSSGEVSIRSTL